MRTAIKKLLTLQRDKMEIQECHENYEFSISDRSEKSDDQSINFSKIILQGSDSNYIRKFNQDRRRIARWINENISEKDHSTAETEEDITTRSQKERSDKRSDI